MKIGLQGRQLAQALMAVIALCSAPAIADDTPSTPAQWQHAPEREIINRNAPLYPATAKRLGQEGRVVMAFDIRSDGLVANAAVVSSEEPALDSAALAVLANWRFAVGAGGGSEGRPYRVGIAFCLQPSSQPTSFDEGVDRVVVSGSRIPGAPVKNPWKKGSAKECK